MDKKIKWEEVNWLQTFESRMKKMIANDEDEFVLGEFQLLQRIMAVEGITGSKLIEFIDIMDMLIKDEISKRWMEEKTKIYGQVG
jgi:hypothetical protein